MKVLMLRIGAALGLALIFVILELMMMKLLPLYDVFKSNIGLVSIIFLAITFYIKGVLSLTRRSTTWLIVLFQFVVVIISQVPATYQFNWICKGVEFVDTALCVDRVQFLFEIGEGLGSLLLIFGAIFIFLKRPEGERT